MHRSCVEGMNEAETKMKRAYSFALRGAALSSSANTRISAVMRSELISWEEEREMSEHSEAVTSYEKPLRCAVFRALGT